MGAIADDAATASPRSSKQVKGWQWTKSAAARRLFKWGRWLHVYLSTATLSLLLFFCVTGVTLNHADWFDAAGEQGNVQLELPVTLQEQLRGESEPLAEVEAFIAAELGLSQPREINLDRELGEWTFDYPLPAGYAFVTLFLDDGSLEVDFQKGSLVGIFNDLHKGRHTGAVWSWVIDISAILLCMVALTGLVILFQQAKWRVTGLLWVIAGTLLPWVIYLIWVPGLK